MREIRSWLLPLGIGVLVSWLSVGCSDSPQDECPADVFCADGEGVRDGECVPCEDGSWSEAPRAITYEGDTCSPRRLNFTCDPLACPEDTFFDRNACLPCPEGTRNPIDPNLGGADETCEPTICAEDEYVSDGACVACPEGATNPAGDDPSGVDTSCTPDPCRVDEHVVSNECVACPAGTVNEAGDDPGSDDTACRAPLSFDPEVLHHGSVSVGEQGTLYPLTLTNQGHSPIEGPFETELSGLDASEFLVDSNDCREQDLPVGDSCVIGIRFAPRTVGAKAALLTVHTSIGSFDVENVGDGITAPGIFGTPTSNNFQSVVVGTTSMGTAFVVFNDAANNTGTFNVRLAGDDAGEFVIVDDQCVDTSLGGGQQCSVTVAFRPTSLGPARADLIAAAMPGGTVSLALYGSGVDSPSSVWLSPLYSDFGAVQIGQTSGARTFTARNDGNSPSGVLTASLTGASPEEFTVVSDSCSATQLMPGASCEIDVLFSPTVEGNSVGELLLSQEPGGEPRAELSGDGAP